MNREIKFRAWETELEEMIPASHIAGLMLEPIDGENNHDRILHYSHSPISKAGYCLEDGLNSEFYILMQCTGLKDKNGIEIYEGDIVKNKDGSLDEITWDEVAFHLAMALAANPDGKCLPLVHKVFDAIEVVGNKYENPELLK